jgi:hypothetical protein
MGKARKIKRLKKALKRCGKVRDEWCREYTLVRDELKRLNNDVSVRNIVTQNRL